MAGSCTKKSSFLRCPAWPASAAWAEACQAHCADTLLRCRASSHLSQADWATGRIERGDNGREGMRGLDAFSSWCTASPVHSLVCHGAYALATGVPPSAQLYSQTSPRSTVNLPNPPSSPLHSGHSSRSSVSFSQASNLAASQLAPLLARANHHSHDFSPLRPMRREPSGNAKKRWERSTGRSKLD